MQLCDEYGVDVVTAFVNTWQDYPERMAIEAIRRLPNVVVFKEYKHDSELEEFPGGIPVRAKLMVDPEEAYITIDLTDNIDNIPMGINLTEASTLAACMIGVFNVLNEVDPAIPRCSGSFRRVKVIMREGSAVGKPRFPAATSSGTTGLCQVLASLIQGAFADLGGPGHRLRVDRQCAIVRGH